MIVERSMHPDWLSNTYLVAAGPGGDGFFVDAGGPVRPLLDAAEEHDIRVTHVLLTHHHHDHVAELEAVRRRFPDAQVLIHPSERDLVDGATGTVEDGDELTVGGLRLRVLHTPGHTRGMIALLAGGREVFSRRHAVQELRRRRPGAGPHDLRRPQALDHGRAARAPARDGDPAGPHGSDHRGRRAASPTPSCASGAGSTPRAAGRARRWASRRRWSCSATTTTAATRRGCAGRTAREDIVPGSQVQTG